MKKLMIAACAVALATAVQAANCTWSSLALNGSDGETLIGDQTAQGWIFQISAEDYTALSKLGAADGMAALYNGFDKENGKLTIGENTYTAFDAAEESWDGVIGFKAMKGYDSGDHSTVAAIFLLDEKNTPFADATHYMANIGDQEMGSKNLAPEFGNWAGGSEATTWTATAVPEPTSGLLLLLGVAGLALKRRRA